MSQRRTNIIEENSAIQSAIQATKGFDVFPKIQEDYVETSSTRGTFSIIVYFSIVLLVIFEVKYFFDDQLHYSYEVDFDYINKLKLNIDMTIASRCDLIGADVLDSTSTLLNHQELSMKDTWFELSPKQQMQFEIMAGLNKHIRDNYHALHSALWFKNSQTKFQIKEREVLPSYPMNACRVYGSLDLNKVFGLFHIIAGKPINIMGQHGHAMKMFQEGATNFSHRIDDFSFGDDTHLVENALNFENKVNNDLRTMYQYFISVVATDVGDKKTYQYSVTERESVADHSTGNHGQPGIYFKYDISPIKVNVTLDKKPYRDLFISLIGLIGGIFATSTMVNALIQAAKEYFQSS